MDQPLWAFEDVVRFVDHPDTPLREWAVAHLIRDFPGQAGEALVTRLDDPHFHVALQAAEFLGSTGDRERYGPRLLEQLGQVRDEYFDYVALALARLACHEALPLLLERLDLLARDPDRFGPGPPIRLLQALGLFRGAAVRQALWQTFSSFPRDVVGRPYAIIALLEAALPEDVERLVLLYRSREAGPDRRRYLEALASAAGVGRLAEELQQVMPAGLLAVLDEASWWFGVDPPLSEACLDGLDRVFCRKYRGAFEVMLAEARRIVEERGDDVEGWRLAWETGIRPLGYHRRTLLALLVLELLAAHPRPHPKLSQQENALGLALLCHLSLDRDDLACLEASGDETEALLDVLLAGREHVLKEVLERVVALGPGIAPRLIALLDPEDFGWGMTRVVRAIEQLARRYPGSCDGAVPLLIETINDEQGDFILEAYSAALVAIGPAAVPAIAERLRDEDMSRQIYLTGVLEEIPTEGSARVLLDWIADGLPVDEMHFCALAGIGSASAIGPLYEIWQEDPDAPELAESLLVLCELHGVEKPELPEWRRIVQDQEAHIAAIFGRATQVPGAEAPGSGGAPGPAVEAPGREAARKPKGVGRKEMKKRAAHRREQRKRKKKHGK